MTISDIEKMTEKEVQGIALECIDLKGHKIYLIDEGGYFGYSKIVFFDGAQIRYANDYELHHRGRSRDELRQMYIDGANHQLFTDDEISEPIKDYHDYEAKRKFIMELIPLRYDHLSMFQILTTKEQEEAFELEKKNYPYSCRLAVSYFKTAEPGNKIFDLFTILQFKKKEAEKNYEYWFDAFYYELGNHEYHINSYQGDYDTLSAFGNIEWHDQGPEARKKYFEELGFSETQIRAFNDARKKYLEDAYKNDWY